MQWIFPTEILLAIYNALVLPHINYCILSWGADSNTIDLFLRPCLCYQLQSIEQNMYVLL